MSNEYLSAEIGRKKSENISEAEKICAFELFCAVCV